MWPSEGTRGKRRQRKGGGKAPGQCQSRTLLRCALGIEGKKFGALVDDSELNEAVGGPFCVHRSV